MQASWRRSAPARPPPRRSEAAMNLVRPTAAVLGLVLLVIGISGFFGFGLAGNPDTHPIFITGQIHDLINIIAGSLALYIAFGLAGRNQAIGLIAFGVL